MNLTSEQKIALRAVQAQEGRKWRAALRVMWERAYYPGLSAHAAVLQQLRNSSAFGPAGLVRLDPANPPPNDPEVPHQPNIPPPG
jgi:hypothetical protein